MPCIHRFQQDLYPNYKLKYLFVGTFNPSWDNANRNNASWFYGRENNSFWNILPHVFGYDRIDIDDDQLRQNSDLWRAYCIEKQIGLTDIIEIIQDADEHNEQHREKILSYSDKQIETFHEFSFTSIEQIIEQNKKSLRGVYLTRYCCTLKRNGILYNRWNQIARLCNYYRIPHSCLVTPSNGYRMRVGEKIQIWRDEIIGDDLYN